jgi:hypothetical protein
MEDALVHEHAACTDSRSALAAGSCRQVTENRHGTGGLGEEKAGAVKQKRVNTGD